MGCGGSKATSVADAQVPLNAQPQQSARMEEATSSKPASVSANSKSAGDATPGGGEDDGGVRRQRSGKTGSLGRGTAKGGDNLVSVALRQKRRQGNVIFGDSNQVTVDKSGAGYVKKVVPKSAEIRAALVGYVKNNTLFGSLGLNELEDLIDAMESRVIPAGTTVIRQGDVADNFYVIESGKFEIIVNDKKLADWGEGTKNRTFGELALLYNSPRAATVVSTTESRVWLIDRRSFRSIIAQSAYSHHQKLKATLKKGILEDLSDEQLDRIAGAATEVRFSRGDQIIKKGDEGEVFYIIEEGSVICKNLGGDQSNNILHAGDYFGERALIKKEPRAADVFAETETRLIALHRDDFEALLGHLRELLEHNLGMRLLLCVPMLGQLGDADRDTLFRALKVVSYRDGQTVLSAGTVPERFYIVKEGSVVIRGDGTGPAAGVAAASSRDITQVAAGVSPRREGGGAGAQPGSGSQRDLGVLNPGHWFPDRELSQQAPCPVAYVARATDGSGSGTQLFVISRDVFMSILAPLAAAQTSRDGASTLSSAKQNGAAPTPPATGGANGSGPAFAGANGASGGPGPGTPGAPLLAGDGGPGAASPAPGAAPGGGGGGAGPDVQQRRTSETRPTSAYANAAAAPPRKRLGLPFRELEQKATLGTGTFGRVRLVHHRKTNRVFALKMLQKSQIVQLKQQTNIMNEREILWRVDHPFVIQLYDTYKDRDRLYMLIELVQGGELFSRLQNSSPPGRIAPSEARFYSACVLDAFDYLHSLNILYRDLKPENLLIDAEGYLKLVDFGFAKIVTDKTYTLCGTPEYLAPELVLGRGHDKGVDYWALGILLYEQVAGYSPFADHANNDQMVICRNILRGDLEFPAHFKDKDLKDVISKLLVKDTSRRLGCLRGGTLDIKGHRFFRPVEWERLLRREVAAPWRPKLANPLDTSCFDAYDEDDTVQAYREDPSAADWAANF